MTNKTLIIYYLYILAIVALFGYAIYFRGASAWLILLAIFLIEKNPYNPEND